MENQGFVKDYEGFITFQAERYGKATLFQNGQALVGLNCFEPGQMMEKHAHEAQTRFYLVLEGGGRVMVGEAENEVVRGDVVWVPPHNAHRIVNSGKERLVMLVGITPSKCD